MKNLVVFTVVIIGVAALVVLFIRRDSKDDSISINETSMKLTLTSSAFEHSGSIPSRYTCDGENVSPPLRFSNVPEGTQSLALLMDDPDIPTSVKESRGIEVFDHWVVYNMPPETSGIPEGGPVTGSEGVHSGGGEGYTGPCPPDGEHRYFFRLFALDAPVNFLEPPTRREVAEAIGDHVIEKTELVGLYNRP